MAVHPRTAHAPGSITLLFAPPADDDATDRSVGVSLAIADGVTATVGPTDGGSTAVRVDGAPTTFDPVTRALETLDVTATVELEPGVPIGYGFGTSGAATLATVLAADAAFDLDRDRDTLVTIAHRAEVAAGTGLGDVFVQAGGGLSFGLGDTDAAGQAASDSDVSRRDVSETVEYSAFGGMDTATVLDDAATMSRVREAGRAALGRFDPDAPLTQQFELGWPFAEATGLPTDRIREAVDRVEAADGAATMAMLGETVVATGVEGVLDGRTSVTPTGARLIEE